MLQLSPALKMYLITVMKYITTISMYFYGIDLIIVTDALTCNHVYHKTFE